MDELFSTVSENVAFSLAEWVGLGVGIGVLVGVACGVGVGGGVMVLEIVALEVSFTEKVVELLETKVDVTSVITVKEMEKVLDRCLDNVRPGVSDAFKLIEVLLISVCECANVVVIVTGKICDIVCSTV